MIHKICIVLMSLFASCTFVSKEKIEENKQTNKGNVKISFRFFSRDVSSINYYYTNQDILIIEQFKPKELHLAQLVEFAVNYRDTAKAENPISAVYFLGEKEGEHFDLRKSKIYDFDENTILSVWFENNLEVYKDKKHPSIKSLTIWKGNKLSKEFESNKIDSLIKANPSIENFWESEMNK